MLKGSACRIIMAEIVQQPRYGGATVAEIHLNGTEELSGKPGFPCFCSRNTKVFYCEIDRLK